MNSGRIFIRNFEAWSHLESFLVSAVAAVLGIRLYLRLTGYPKLGGGGLHIAHMLWGGLLMLAAIIILFSFLTKSTRRAAAVLAGIGFGTFIDEVGKFITEDNDYFFQPAVALIYIAFILTLLTFHVIHSRQRYTDKEYLMNALHEMEEMVVRDLDEEEKDRALYFLRQSGLDHPLARAMKEVLSDSVLLPASSPGVLTRLKHFAADYYYRIAGSAAFAHALIVFFIAQLLLKLIYVLVLVFFLGLGWDEIGQVRLLERVTTRVEALSFTDWAQMLSWLLSGSFVFMGVIRMRQSRVAALQMFERSILVSIFLTQVFSFYQEQFSALAGLLFNIAILIALRYMIEHERLKSLAAKGPFHFNHVSLL